MVFNNVPDDESRQRAIEEIRALGGQITFTEHNTFKIQFPQED